MFKEPASLCFRQLGVARTPKTANTVINTFVYCRESIADQNSVYRGEH